MTTEFEEKLKLLLDSLPAKGYPAGPYVILHDGENDPVFADDIRSINRRYNHTDSESMQGNWLILHTNDHCSAVRMDLDTLEETARRDGWQETEDTVAAALHSALLSNSLIASMGLTDFESVRNRLVVQAAANRSVDFNAEDPVCRSYGDFSLIVYVEVSALGGQYLSFKLKHSMCADWGMTDDEIFRHALLNMSRRYPPCLIEMPLRYPQAFTDERTDFTDESYQKKIRHICLLNDRSVNGASALFYPGVMKRLYTLAGCPFYAVFTSSQEVHIHSSEHFTAPDLKQILLCSNTSFPSVQLTSSVFIYDPSSDTIKPLNI